MAKVAKVGARKKRNGYQMPDPLPEGEILKDISNKKWKLGSSIGKGGFGVIYTAQEYSESLRSTSTFPYVVKIEPHSNGPLFVEMHFFMRNAKKEDVETFMASKKLKSLGMPIYHGSGSHTHESTKYRFLVIDKFGVDIWKIYLENGKKFNPAAVYKVGIQIMYVLEYIHSKGYVHADIKGANILIGLKNKNQVYLVDYGLATHYSTNAQFKPDPKKAHDGTIEYTSRDAHCGVPTRRGDLEILIYNFIHWLGCTLPWETLISDPVAVKNSKEKFMDDIPLFMKTCFGNQTPPAAIVELLKYQKTLKFNSEINYKTVHTILEKGLQSVRGSKSSPLVFKTSKSPAKRKTASETPLSGQKKKINRRKLADSCTEEEDEEKEPETDSDELEVVENKPKNDTPKRRGRKPTIKKVVPDNPDTNNEDNDDSESSYTAEMKRIRKKIEDAKQTKRPKRSRAKKHVVDDDEIDENPSNSTTPIRKLKTRSQVKYRAKQKARRDSSNEDTLEESDDY